MRSIKRYVNRTGGNWGTGWLALLVAWGAVAEPAAAEPNRNLLPDKIAGIYHGLFIPHSEAGVDGWIETALDPMAEAGFNTWYHKIQPYCARSGPRELGNEPGSQIDLTHPVQYERVRALAEACEERGLTFIAYTYHYPHGMRDPNRYGPEVLAYPPLVMADGTVQEDRFGVANWDTWLFITGAALQLAEASLTLPIAAVGLDHEHFSRGTISYDDEAWGDFAAAHDLDASLAPEKRGGWVREKGLRETYDQWYQARWDDIVRRWVERIHGINPYLSIAIVPMHGREDWFGMPFLRHAGTEKAPAIIDCWHLYNGSGLTEGVKRFGERVKAYNPHNLHVEWLRPDSYRLEDIPVQVYHCLLELDGYSNWHVRHITEPETRGRAESPEAFWAAYRAGNTAFFADRAAGAAEPSIPFRPVTPMVAGMPEVDGPVPQLVPHGDGSGEDRWIPKREVQQVLIYAEAGEQLSGKLRHLAGAHRPLGLQYLLVHPDGSWLYDNSVMPGQTHSFSVTAHETGTYALYVTGGRGGQAWYAVKIHNPWHAFPITDETRRGFLFYDHFEFDQEGFGFPVELFLRRSDPSAPASIAVRGDPIYAEVDGHERRLVIGEHRRYGYTPGTRTPERYDDPTTFALPAGDDPVSVRLSAPGEVMPDQRTPRWREYEKIATPFHIQGVSLTTTGAVHPYAAIAPGRMLLPAE